jgi:hypothetical protein
MKNLARILIGVLFAASAHASYLAGVGQGSTTSGQSGFLNQAASTTNPPSYTTGQTNPLSQDLLGNLRVNFPDYAATGNITTQNLNPNSGTATAGSTVSITGLNNANTLIIGVQGTYTGALTVQVSADGSNWIASNSVSNYNTGALTGTIASAAVGVWQTGVEGFTAVRLSANSAVTGTATVTIRVAASSATVAIDQSLPAGTNTLGAVNQGGAPWTDNITQFGGVNLSTGTGASGTGIPRVTVSNDSNILATQSGTWNVGGLGSSGSPAGGVFSVQGVSGGTAIPVSGSFSLSGTTSNASSGVATSSTNNPNVDYLYGFNGTTWDQLRDDAQFNLKTIQPDLQITGQGSQTALNNNIILATAGTAATPTAGYHSWSIEIVPASGTVTAGIVTFEGSNDNVNFQTISLVDMAAPTGPPQTNDGIVASSNRFFAGPIQFAYIRARISTAITGTTAGVQAFTQLFTAAYAPIYEQGVSPTAGNFFATISAVTATNISTNIAEWNGNTPASAGVTGVVSVGGNVAAGSAATIDPVLGGIVDSNNLTRKVLGTPLGEPQVIGTSESVTPFSLGTGASAVTDGTNGKTINCLSGKEGDVYLYVSSVSTSPTMQVEISYINSSDYAVIPLTRIDNTAASQQFASVAAFTPVAGAVYRGKTYGADIIRVHLTAGTTSNTTGALRIQYQPEMPGVLVSPFAFQSTGTTEAVGSANGQVYTGSIRTLTIPARGATTATLVIESNTGGSNVVALEGSQDYGATWNALSMQPVNGGATVSNFTNTGTAALPGAGIYQCDVSNQTEIRAHCTTYGSGTVYGYLKIVNTPSALPGNSRKPTYTFTVSLSPTATLYAASIASGASKTVTLKRVIIMGGAATSSGFGTMTLIRGTVTAPGGGASITASTMQHNPADPATTATVLSGTTTITTSGVTLTNTQTVIPFAIGSSSTSAGAPTIYDFTDGGQCEGFQIPVGAANSVLFQVTGAAGSGGEVYMFQYTEE